MSMDLDSAADQIVTYEHDTRSVVVIVSSDDGYISKTWKGADIDIAQEFVSKIMNAAVAYPQHKAQFLADKQSLTTRYNKLCKILHGWRLKKRLTHCWKHLIQRCAKMLLNSCGVHAIFV